MMIIAILQTFSRFSITHHFGNHGPSLQHGCGGGRVWHYDGIQVFRAGRAGLAHRKMHITASGSHINTVSKIKLNKNPGTLFENYSECRIWIFDILAFSTNFCPIKIYLSGNTVWPQASGFQKLAKLTNFGDF